MGQMPRGSGGSGDVAAGLHPLRPAAPDQLADAVWQQHNDRRWKTASQQHVAIFVLLVLTKRRDVEDITIACELIMSYAYLWAG